MDGIKFSIIEEWHHAVYDDLVVRDCLHFQGLTLDGLLTKHSRYRLEWLMHVQTARAAVGELVEPDAVLDNNSDPELTSHIVDRSPLAPIFNPVKPIAYSHNLPPNITRIPVRSRMKRMHHQWMT
jgi:hypothetical protein